MTLLSMSALCQMMPEKTEGQSSSLFKVEGMLLFHVYGTQNFLGASNAEMRFYSFMTLISVSLWYSQEESYFQEFIKIKMDK